MLNFIPIKIINIYKRFVSFIFTELIRYSFGSFGRGSLIVPPIRLERVNRIRIGKNVYIGSHSWLITIPDETNNNCAIRIGDNTSFVGNCTISATREVIIEQDVLFAGNVYISDHSHAYSNTKIPIKNQGITKISPVRIRKNSWIGQNVVICPGVTVGVGSVIGANSFVNKNIPNHCVAAGSPAKVIKSF